MDSSTIGLIVILGLAAALFGIVIYSFVSQKRKERNYNEVELKEKEITVVRATAADKKAGGRYEGSYKTPSYHEEYRVLFRLADGRERWLRVGRWQFEEIPLGTLEDLILEDGAFLDFGGRFGNALMEEESEE